MLSCFLSQATKGGGTLNSLSFLFPGHEWILRFPPCSVLCYSDSCHSENMGFHSSSRRLVAVWRKQPDGGKFKWKTWVYMSVHSQSCQNFPLCHSRVRSLPTCIPQFDYIIWWTAYRTSILICFWLNNTTDGRRLESCMAVRKLLVARLLLHRPHSSKCAYIAFCTPRCCRNLKY